MRATLIILALSATAHAQTVVGRASKETFKSGEEITLEYRAEFGIDSAIIPAVDGLRFGSPARSTNLSINNGITRRSTTFTFRTTATRSGRYIIASPRFVSDEKDVHANVISVLAEDIPLTAADMRHASTKELIKEFLKPEGTRTYVISGRLGYITEVTDGETVYVRDLTEKEIEAIRALN